ncbi:MAG: hypothetical protein WEB88_11950 [Gemmatimonadota bacterium]
MTGSSRSGGLHIIFSLFLGLMLSTFAGVAVYTFYPPPERFEEQIRELNREEEAIRSATPSDERPVEERDRLRRISLERDELRDAAREARVPWSRNTSLILVAFATLAMAVSLVRADRLPVISNGLLLGGLFTMLYGVGWIVVTESSLARFLTMTAALFVTLGLGYLRFVRRGSRARMRVEAGALPENGLAELEGRIRDLEERTARAALVLGQTRRDMEVS